MRPHLYSVGLFSGSFSATRVLGCVLWEMLPVPNRQRPHSTGATVTADTLSLVSEVSTLRNPEQRRKVARRAKLRSTLEPLRLEMVLSFQVWGHEVGTAMAAIPRCQLPVLTPSYVMGPQAMG